MIRASTEKAIMTMGKLRSIGILLVLAACKFSTNPA